MLFLITLSLLSSVAVYATNSTNSTNSTNPNIIRRLLTLDAWHGGSGGYFYVMESSKSSAYITKICVRDGDVIDEIQVWFNNGETSGPYGGPGGEYSCYQVSDGNCITSVNGREGGLIDSLQFFGSDGSRSLYWGSYGGDEFSEQGTGCLKSLYIRAGAFLDGLQFNWKGPLECPAGSKQIGVLNSDIAGCGIEGCDKRYQDNYETIEDCLAGCRSISNCKSFSWAPLNGDKNHPGKTVCTLYDSNKANQIWAPQQILCDMNNNNNPTYIGCYKDDIYDRAMTVVTWSGSSLESCLKDCDAYNYMGLEYPTEGQCLCSNSYEQSTKHGASNACEGNGLGGPYAIDLYEINK
eukprot:936608_1